MKKSHYFSELTETYSTEIDDLLSDSEGKTVLQKRLKEKRDMFDDILPMIEFSPEMVAVAFYDAFGFKEPAALAKVVLSEPGHAGFPAWKNLKKSLTVAAWAEPLIAAALDNEAGDQFLVTSAALEFLRLRDVADLPAATDEAEERNDEDDDESGDLGEAGNDWMAEQGFDSLER
jgi:hypothetical protein